MWETHLVREAVSLDGDANNCFCDQFEEPDSSWGDGNGVKKNDGVLTKSTAVCRTTIVAGKIPRLQKCRTIAVPLLHEGGAYNCLRLRAQFVVRAMENVER